MSDPFDGLVREVERLLLRVRGWSISTWQAPARSGGSRADRMGSLAEDLAELGRRAGSGAPAGAVLPRPSSHALADQVTVLAEDLLAALLAALEGRQPGPGDWAGLVDEARAAVLAARTDLEPGRPRMSR